MHMRTSQRGSALIIAVIVVMIVSVIGIGILRFAFRETAGATAGAREQALISCAESARQLLVSQFNALGLQPTAITALNVPLDTTSGAGSTFAVGGHYGTSGVTVAQVTYLPESAFGATNRARDLTNIIAVAGQGGRPLKVVVHCQAGGTGTPESGRQLEVEFGVRFGL
jgi:Tfp pilus assembly protein PilX